MSRLLAGRRILVVEDEMLVLMVTEDMLGDLGCDDITAAATVDRALALIHDQPFDLAMLDMNLDGEGTEAVADALAARGVPFIFATGYVSRDMRGHHSDHPLLKKPFPAGALERILERLLAKPAI